jgi:hypothetical protein
MTEEIVNPTPKETEYIVTLPDREKQWEKCPAIVKKTKTVTHLTIERKDGVEKEGKPESYDIPYTEMAMEGEGQTVKVVKLSEVKAKVSKLSDSLEFKEQILMEALTATYADSHGSIDDKALKEQATWGLGCPAFCGGYREFTYAEMVPQTYACPKCGVIIHLK